MQGIEWCTRPVGRRKRADQPGLVPISPRVHGVPLVLSLQLLSIAPPFSLHGTLPSLRPPLPPSPFHRPHRRIAYGSRKVSLLPVPSCLTILGSVSVPAAPFSGGYTGPSQRLQLLHLLRIFEPTSPDPSPALHFYLQVLVGG